MKLELSVEQVNVILQALGNAPYVSVASVIAEIQRQGQEQLNQSPNPEPAP
mgnify:CR=1 FL=1